MPTRAEHDQYNEDFYEAYSSDDPRLQKIAAEATEDYTRLKIREDGVTRRVLPCIDIGNSDLDRQSYTTLPTKIVDMEVDSPAAISVPLATFPSQIYMRAQRYMVMFHRILSPWFQADIGELRTNVMDIRQVLSDNSIKDMAAEEDRGFFSSVNTILVGQDQVQPFSGIAQWVSNPSSISRNSLADMKKVMLRTDGHLAPVRMVVNNVTHVEFSKFGFDENGGDKSQELFRQGWTEDKIMDIEILSTIKRNLVPDNSAFLFADPRFMGRFYALENTTMYIERKAFFLSFFSYEQIGMTIANPYSLARYDFAA